MIFFLISVLAGILTIIAPCILPLLPIVIGTADGTKKGITRRAVVVIGSLSVSVILFTLLLKASTLLIDIPTVFWSWFSGGIILFLGVVIIFPNLWSKISLIQKINLFSNKALGYGYQKNNNYGDVIIGLSLGPIFTTCSPTYFFILATVLPASPFTGFLYLLGFTFGMAISLLAVAYLGQRFIGKFFENEQKAEKTKKFFGFLFVVVGIIIIMGYDKTLSSLILDHGLGGSVNFEENLINTFYNK